MKNTLTFVLLGLLLSTPIFAQTADQEAIKKVCLEETKAFIDFNFDVWAAYHVQSAEDQLAWNNPDGSFGSSSGWDEIQKGMKSWFQTAQKVVDNRTNDNFSFVIHGDMAFVAYNSNSVNAEGKTTKLREYRTLLKNNGKWKILAVQAFVDYPSGK